MEPSERKGRTMRISVAIRTLALLIAFASPAFLCAQFQEPTPEELKMTDDPKSPGAAAVYLNVEEIANDPIHYQSFYARIKVLQEKGKELATVEIPYLHGNYKIADIKARTIHSDGTVIPLVGKPEDLLAFKSKDRNGESTQVNRKVFTLPNVEVGSILEYRYQLDYDENHYSSPTWDVQKPYFVHKAHYLFTPFKAFLPGAQNATSMYLMDERGRVLRNLLWWSNLPTGVAVKSDAGGHFGVDVTDIPAIPDEEWMPPIKSFLYKVEFDYKSETNSANFWNAENKLWSKDVDHFAETSKTIKGAVAGLVAPTDSELDKAKKLYVAVQALDNTDYSRKKTESELKQLKIKTAKHAQDTWEQKSGSSEDIALLYLAMLRAAGLNANAMKVVNREQGLFDPTHLTLYQLDDTIVLLNTGGKEIGLDPGEKMCPFKTVSWRHSLASGLRQGGGDKFMVTSPGQIYPDNKAVRTGDITLDAQGAITGTLSFVMTGQEALNWRQTFLRNDLDEVKKQFDHSLESQVPEGVEAHLDHFLGLDDPYVNLVAIINVHGNLGSATSKRLLLPGFFFETRGSHPFVNQEKRLEPVDMQYDQQIADQIVYHLPAGLTVEGTPQNNKVSWPQHAVYATKVVTAQGQVTVARQLSRAFTFAKAEEYNDLRSFYQKVAAADQQQLVLTTSAAPKGN
jgi:hypothetical protein